jgi:hypothetical protein
MSVFRSETYSCNSCGVPDDLCNMFDECIADVWHTALSSVGAPAAQTDNNARAKSAPEIVESNSPCQYCSNLNINLSSCSIPNDCNDHDHFTGRRLSPVA